MGTRAGLVGREAERQLLRSVLADAAGGQPSAVLLAGEAGVGKTRLVTELAEEFGSRGHLVLWGRCLRFGADSSPYLPIGQLLTQWHRRAGPDERAGVLAGAEHLASIAPALGTPAGPADSGRLIPLVSTVLDRLAERAPLVVVVDDLHWADSSSLDLLAYLVAGFAPGQRLAVLGTYRDTDLVEGHRLHGWLADLRRLPSVTLLPLQRLGLAAVEQLVADVCGEAGTLERSLDLFSRAEGNPYLTELLARAQPGAGERGHDDLRHALLASWHRLRAPARELVQLLAVGGRPVAVGVLARLVATREQDDVGIDDRLAEAAAEGLLAIDRNGEVWFHHPLIADVVASTLTPDALVSIHREYVEVLEPAEDLPFASRAAHLALHHDGGRNPDRAFVWSLRAADAAAGMLAFAEESEHLHRACRLWPLVGAGPRATAGERVDLLARASDSARRAGEHLLAVRLREEAIGLVDPVADPLRAVRLRQPLHHLRVVAGLDVGPQVGVNREILEIAERCPGTVEHAVALANVAFAELWNGVSDAVVHAGQAVEIARALDSEDALAWTLGVRSQTRLDTVEAVRDAEQTLELAMRSADHELPGNAAVWLANALQAVGRIGEAADCLVRVFRELAVKGSVQDAVFANPGYAALLLVELGRWDEARGLLRELLSRRLAADPSAGVRGAASLLALRSGDEAAGRAHMARARELQPDLRPGDVLTQAEVQLHWACHEPERALECVVRTMPAQGAVDPEGADELLVWAARAAADLAETARSTAVERLAEVEALRGDEPAWFSSGVAGDLLHPARAALFAAERARCLGTQEALPDLWATAVSSCRRAGLVWEEALASYRLGQAILTGGGRRTDAAAALRSGAAIARRLGAVPILADVEALARHARIPLEEPTPVTDPAGPGEPVLGRLTPREREVLALLVAGRTYAEMAEELFISEKTVSVHVSNLLRKTGTASRIEVAELARGRL